MTNPVSGAISCAFANGHDAVAPYATKADNETIGETPADDRFDAAFDAVAAREELAALRSDVAALKARPAASLIARPALDGVKAAADDPQRRAFVDRYVRHGLESQIAVKSLNGTSGETGGVAVPREIDADIARQMKSLSPIRAIANVVQTGTAGYRKLVSDKGLASGWVAETVGRPETATPKFVEIAPPMGELYANPAASQAMLDDAAFDVEAWLAEEIAREFAVAEGAAFVSGSGIDRPRGFMTYPVSTDGDAARKAGTLQYVASGAEGAFGSGGQADKLVELVHALRAPYRQGAVFVMASDTLSRIRRFKTADGQYLWQPALTQGQPDMLLGYPVIEAEDMPVVAKDALAIAFGNFRLGYTIADRGETQILRDPYSNKPFVHFYATKRVGGAVTNSEAIKLMRFSAN